MATVLLLGGELQTLSMARALRIVVMKSYVLAQRIPQLNIADSLIGS